MNSPEVYKYLPENLFCSMYLEVELLGNMLIVHKKNFRGTTRLLSVEAVPFWIPIGNKGEFLLLHIPPGIGIVSSSAVSHIPLLSF